MLVYFRWPRNVRNYGIERRTFLPTAYVDGERVPPGRWGIWLYATRPGEVQVRTVQGGDPETASKFVRPVSETATAAPSPDDFGRLEYFPSVPQQGYKPIDGTKALLTLYAQPQMPEIYLRRRISLWRRSMMLRAYTYAAIVTAALGGAAALARVLNGQ